MTRRTAPLSQVTSPAVTRSLTVGTGNDPPKTADGEVSEDHASFAEVADVIHPRNQFQIVHHAQQGLPRWHQRPVEHRRAGSPNPAHVHAHRGRRRKLQQPATRWDDQRARATQPAAPGLARFAYLRGADISRRASWRDRVGQMRRGCLGTPTNGDSASQWGLPRAGRASEIGGMPPAWRNHRLPAGADTPTFSAASAEMMPVPSRVGHGHDVSFNVRQSSSRARLRQHPRIFGGREWPPWFEPVHLVGSPPSC